MFKFWSIKHKCLDLRQLLLLSGLLMANLAQGQSSPVKIGTPERKPASYIPDDDVIVKPVDNQLSFYQQYVASDNGSDVVTSRNQLKVWQDNQNFANQYGMDSSLSGSPYFVPTPDAKWSYFKDKYFRYLRSKGEQPLKDVPKNWYQEYRASNEVDTIDELESRFKSKNKSESSKKSLLPQSLQQREISIWKKTNLIFQPRVDQGLVIVGLQTPYGRARAWVGVNGRTEVNVQQTYDSIGMRVMVNYYAYTGKYFTSVDQRLVENVYARVTSQKDPLVLTKVDNTLMLLYARQF